MYFSDLSSGIAQIIEKVESNMAGANVMISNLIAALSKGDEVKKLRAKMNEELEGKVGETGLLETESIEQKERTKTVISSLSVEVSNKRKEITRLRREKETEMEEEDFIEEEDQNILQAYLTAEREVVQLNQDIQKIFSQNYGGRTEGETEIVTQHQGLQASEHQGTDPIPGTSSSPKNSSSTKRRDQLYAGKELRQKEKHKCPLCGDLYHSRWLKEHKKLCGKKEREKFQCSKCNSSYLTKPYLEKHIKVCTGKKEKSKSCSKCKKGEEV